jgi:hypothetical protein
MLMSMVHEQHIFQYRGEDRHHIQPQRPNQPLLMFGRNFSPQSHRTRTAPHHCKCGF